MKTMKRIVALILTCAIIIVAALFTIPRIVVVRECRIDFVFWDSSAAVLPEPKMPVAGDFSITYVPASMQIAGASEGIAHNFLRWLSWQRSDREWKRFIQNNSHASCLREMEDEELARLVSSAEFKITGMPMTNFVFGCEIRLPDLPGRNIDDVARAFVAVLADFVSDLNEVNVYRASFMEQQEKARRERKIAQLEKAGDRTAIELASEWNAIKELDAKIAAVRRQVLEACEKRITNVVISTTASIKWRRMAQYEARCGFDGVRKN